MKGSSACHNLDKHRELEHLLEKITVDYAPWAGAREGTRLGCAWRALHFHTVIGRTETYPTFMRWEEQPMSILDAFVVD
jgi:hypothetical protein